LNRLRPNFSLKMKSSLLQIIHRSALKRATSLNYPGNFPKILNSLKKDNPTNIDINKDYLKMKSHFKHPVFLDWVPNYDEIIKNPYSAWLKRCSNSYKNLIPK